MEHRLSEKNKITHLLSSLTVKLERVRKSKEDLIRSTTIRDRQFKEAQLKENDELIEKYTQEQEDANERLRQLENGDLDDEIMTGIQKNMKTIHKKHEIARKKEEEITRKEIVNKKSSSKFNDSQRSIDYENRQKKYEMQKAYERYCTIEIPSYILENLKMMPNNKGYIWKNVQCYGQLPPTYTKGVPDPVVLFEKQRDVMFIHEISETEHHIFKKVGQQKREYVKGTMRKKRQSKALF
jgi:hypothetical protein